MVVIDFYPCVVLKALLESMFPRRRSTYIWDEVEYQQDSPISILGAGLLESRGNRESQWKHPGVINVSR